MSLPLFLDIVVVQLKSLESGLRFIKVLSTEFILVVGKFMQVLLVINLLFNLVKQQICVLGEVAVAVVTWSVLSEVIPDQLVL